jgi:fructokinase
MDSDAPHLAGIELGGTKTIVLRAEGMRIVERVRLETRAPAETLAAANRQLLAWHAARPLAALGIASFGPIGLRPDTADHGRMLPTPKPGWAGADILGALSAGLDCPIAIDTDVTAAALAHRLPAAGEAAPDCFWYITIGTGLGGGLFANGRPLHGAMHPEIGHIRVRRAADPGFAGTCPFHGDCIEGLISGPALAARFGIRADEIADTDPRWQGVAADLGELLATLFLTTAPDRILLGGTVATRRPFLIGMAGAAMVASLAGYLPYVDAHAAGARVRLAPLGEEAGPLGSVALALSALGRI